MPCGRCAERGRAIRQAVGAASRGDPKAAYRAMGFVSRTMTEDAKAFAAGLKARFSGRLADADQPAMPTASPIPPTPTGAP